MVNPTNLPGNVGPLGDSATQCTLLSIRQSCVRPLCFYTSQADHQIAGYTENPFASTHSLDANPFDDPQPASAGNAAKLDEIRRREQELERREAELNNKAEHIRRHGRNNFPPCPPFPSCRVHYSL